jgi:hypothetical protein
VPEKFGHKAKVSEKTNHQLQIVAQSDPYLIVASYKEMLYEAVV